MTPTTAPASDRQPQASGPCGNARHALLADTELENDPRGGWRFHDPADEACFGTVGDEHRGLVLPQESPPLASEGDSQRLAFAGDAQFPPQGYARSGTQGTWDEGLAVSRPP